MLEGIVADVLVRVLGSYVDGLNKESIRVGVWRGDLELKHLRLRPDALAVLFETLGLDLPVTVTAGYIGLLRLEVPWKTLRSAPVRIFMHDVTVVASPVSDGDQSALELRERRLKVARLATDEAVRDAKFSVGEELRGMTPSTTRDGLADTASEVNSVAESQSGYRVARWGWRFTSKVVTKIVDNIQIDVENVVVQYEDSSSVRNCPYTATLALDSLRACSTNHQWTPVFIENPSSPIVHKVLYMRGLVLNWEPSHPNNELKAWILDPKTERTAGQWAGFVRACSRHAIKPMDGELRIALTKGSALAAALAGKDEELRELKKVPRVQMDLHFPDVRISLDDFQYHTLLSTIMYLSDIDRKVRPKTARGRWFWALDRLLPQFKQRREAAMRFNVHGLRERREKREAYCKARNAVVTARRRGAAEPKKDARIVEEIESDLSYDDIILFRDIADQQLIEATRSGGASNAPMGRFWSLFTRGRETPGGRSQGTSGRNTPKRSRSRESLTGISREGSRDSLSRSRGVVSNEAPPSSQNDESQRITTGGDTIFEDPFSDGDETLKGEMAIPNFRMGFLLGRGAIQLKEGGYPEPPIPISSLEFGELRVGIETRPGSGLLLEALLGTFQVIDLQKQIKVMYPRAPWAGNQASDLSGCLTFHDADGESIGQGVSRDLFSELGSDWEQSKLCSSDVPFSGSRASTGSTIEVARLRSYPHDITNAICEIRGEYGIESEPLPTISTAFPCTKAYPSNFGSESSGSLSALSDGAASVASLPNIEDLSVPSQTPLKYIAALRLNHEEAPDGEWARGATRLAMDLAIGGMEVLLDGPKGAFVSSITFWHAREKMPSIMHFLSRAAAPRLASLRMEIQKALLERSVPMRMDMLIRGPRFVVPGSPGSDVSLVVDLGTFAMETSTGSPEVVTPEIIRATEDDASGSLQIEADPISIRYTDYKMAFTELGLFIVSEAGKQAAERVIKPFSVHLLLQVLHNSSFIEAMTLVYGKVEIPKTKLQAQLPSLRTSVSHNGFRQILEVAKGWGQHSRMQLDKSGIEPNKAAHSVSVAPELEGIRHTRDTVEGISPRKEAVAIASPLVAFQMKLEFEDLQLELRDASARRVVTVSSTGTLVKLKRRTDFVAFDFRVRTFTVIDGSRGATAPFRRLAYAGVEREDIKTHGHETFDFPSASADNRSFISLSYRGDRVLQEQSVAVKILSLNLLCVRESYFALADFFYLKDKRSPASKSSWASAKDPGRSDWADFRHTTAANGDSNEAESEYSDPFAALGMTTSGAARALRQQANIGMELSKQALADRGRLSVSADLDGLNVTLVTADGAIGSFDVTDCKTRLTQFSSGAVEASGELGGFGVRDLTSAYDVYSETIRYQRGTKGIYDSNSREADGWAFRVGESGHGDMWLEARLKNLRIVYLQRFTVILKKYFDALRDSLKPVLDMKGGIGEVFEGDDTNDFIAIPKISGRVRLNIVTEDIDIVMPRHSQSPYEALRFFVPRSSITNEDLPAPGYKIGVQIMAEGVRAYVLYEPPAQGEGRALTVGGTEPVLRQITPDSPTSRLVPFSDNISIVAKLDAWRCRRVPQVVLNTDGIPVLKDGEEEREYDPAKWLPSIRVRVSAPSGISARLCEAEYSILYFTFTENVIERPDIEFTDIVRGLKTPILPTRKPVQPIMFSSNRMPPNYQILFEVPKIESIIMSGADPRDDNSALMRSELRDLVGSFDYGVDFRMSVEVSGNMHAMQDARPSAPSYGQTLIMPIRKSRDHLSPHGGNSTGGRSECSAEEMNRTVTFTWDRPFGFRANIMVVVSDLRIIVEPELFRDLGLLTTPGFPYLKSSAPAPVLRFNGRLLILTISRPEIWLMANQYPGDGRSLVVRGDVIAKVQWAAVTGRNKVEVAANGIHVNLSNGGPLGKDVLLGPRSSSGRQGRPSESNPKDDAETPMVYPCDVSMKFEGSGYDPPEGPDDEPVRAPGSSLSVNAESVLVRIDVNDAPFILAVGSRFGRLRASFLSQRPTQPGRFDEWKAKGEDGDARLALHLALPHCRLMFTDEAGGRYVPIMEARIRNAVVRSNIPWLTNAAFEFALDLFNEDKGWWEPGVEIFAVEAAASQGRSGSQAVHVRAESNIDVNVTPNTVSGASRVSKALKLAVEDLSERLRAEEATDSSPGSSKYAGKNRPSSSVSDPGARRPSVAAFCVRNETGRSMAMWLPYDSKRRALRGNGGEVEVSTPTDAILWTAIGASGGLSADPNKNRQVSMRCVVLLSGYEPVTLSTAETGTRLVTLMPDTHELAALMPGNLEPSRITLVWSVSMRDGVPCGCLRSVVRLLNQTNTVLEVNIGGLTKSLSVGDNVRSEQSGTLGEVDRDAHARLKSGEAWSVPMHAVYRSIRVRPAVFHPPDTDSSSSDDGHEAQSNRGRVCYSYKWSDPLSKVASLHSIGRKLRSKAKLVGEDRASTVKTTGPVTPILSCRAVDARRLYSFSILPAVDLMGTGHEDSDNNAAAWVDVHICPPLVLENLLPRPIFFKLATPGSSGSIRREPVVEQGRIEPLRVAHVHTAGSDLSAVSIAVGMDNSPQPAKAPPSKQALPQRGVGDFHPNLANLKNIPMGSGKYVPFRMSLDQEQKLNTRHVRSYCDFWIRNRSDTDLFFRDRDHGRDSKGNTGPKVFLRGCPPGTVADKFLCFSSPWLSFQRADITEDEWVNVGTEVSEIDKPFRLGFDGISLLLEVRPAKGRFQRALVVTIRNSVWLENRTGAALEWCQPAALNPQGIALSTKVHVIGPGTCSALHWDFKSQKKAICLRRAEESGSGDWIWSRPVLVEGVEGEFAAKMYRPRRHEQYIARVVISKLGRGVSSVIVHKEDRNTPPYRILNLCSGRSIAFRQSGVNETYPWLVKPGKSTRYSWDDPQAPVKRRSLVVEVIDYSGADAAHSDQIPTASDISRSESVVSNLSEISQSTSKTLSKKGKAGRLPKFELNIDMIKDKVPFVHSKRFDPPLTVSVHVEGPTKLVTFRDGEPSQVAVRNAEQSSISVGSEEKDGGDFQPSRIGTRNLDVELFVKAVGISFVEATPTELAYLSVRGIHFRLDRFDGQQLLQCEIADLQLDNQLSHCTWPVVLWSPPPTEPSGQDTEGRGSSSGTTLRRTRKPFFQLTVDGPYPPMKQGIGSFRGIFVALQQLQLAADEDFALRVWLFVVSLIEAAGGTNKERAEALNGKDGLEAGLAFLGAKKGKGKPVHASEEGAALLSRLYVEHLELCPLKLSVSFTSSRTSTAAEHIGGFRSLIRTLVAVLGNVENAEFRFNALELQHVFDTTAHFRSLITEFYVAQGSNQKIVLLASNSLIGNPSALFDSIAIGTRDFFVEPANAKGSADFIASIGRGSSSLLTNTVGGIVGSLGGIPRAVAQGLETAVGDRDYLAERDSIRGGRARIVSSPAQGLFTGALSFGHGIASGAAGLIRDPIQGAAEEGPSGFIKGLGKGFIGGVLKPITGALDLIAEPAAGFRSMMVSERSQDAAEPVRPPRAFWGVNSDRMTSYDLRASLGRAILEVVNRTENTSSGERLLAWTHLVPVHSTATDEDVIAFLWALLRRSTRSSYFQSKYLLDAQGNPQRAEKMRAGLITTERLIVTSLDGHVIWEYPLVDIADTQVSVGAKDYLLVGVRPIGHRSESVAPTGWQKIHCGSMAARNDLNASLRKALLDLKIAQRVYPLPAANLSGEGRPMAAKHSRSEHHRQRSVELKDFSTTREEDMTQGGMQEMKSLHHDASVDGRRGVFTDMKLPGREPQQGPEPEKEIPKDDDLSQQLAMAMQSSPRFQNGAIRSIRLFIVNLTGRRLSLVRCFLDSGSWTCEPAKVVDSRSLSQFEADGTKERAVDVCGRVVYSVGDEVNRDDSSIFAIRFLNPLLSANVYALQAPDGCTVAYNGGEKGDHVTTVVTLKEAVSKEDVPGQSAEASSSRKAAAEPLLFGRSKVSPHLPPVITTPPHVRKKKSGDPSDPELVERVASLGFSREDAVKALQDNDADVAKAYASLLDRRK